MGADNTPRATYVANHLKMTIVTDTEAVLCNDTCADDSVCWCWRG